MRKLKINWIDFEAACDGPTSETKSYLDLETGAVLVVFDETAEQLQELLAEAAPGASVESLIAQSAEPAGQKQALRDAWHVDEHLAGRVISMAEVELRENYRDLEDFTATVPDETVRKQLVQAIQGRGAFRRFKDVIHGCFRERKLWFAFQEQRQRERAAEWLAAQDIEVEWVMPTPPLELPPRPPPRQHLLAGVLKFTRAVGQLPGVKGIALIGSLTRDEPEPKDADVLVRVSDDMDLAPLAKAGRQLGGHAQQLGRGADVFLADERGGYIGRACHWRECGPSYRASCDALHCGRRPYLHDDFRDVRLDASLIAAPPLDLWPQVRARVPVPADVDRVLLAPLRTQPEARFSAGDSA